MERASWLRSSPALFPTGHRPGLYGSKHQASTRSPAPRPDTAVPGALLSCSQAQGLILISSAPTSLHALLLLHVAFKGYEKQALSWLCPSEPRPAVPLHGGGSLPASIGYYEVLPPMPPVITQPGCSHFAPAPALQPSSLPPATSHDLSVELNTMFTVWPPQRPSARPAPRRHDSSVAWAVFAAPSHCRPKLACCLSPVSPVTGHELLRWVDQEGTVPHTLLCS